MGYCEEAKIKELGKALIYETRKEKSDPDTMKTITDSLIFKRQCFCEKLKKINLIDPIETDTTLAALKKINYLLNYI